MIFTEQISRKPNHYSWTQDFIDAMWSGHWTPNEFNFQSDLHDFKTKLTNEEKEIITKTLTAIGQIEIAVKTFWAKLGDNLPHPSLMDLGLTMANIEVIHNGAYEKLISVLGMNELFEENLKIPIIKNRIAYLKKYNKKVYKNDKKQFIYALILFTLFVENVSLFSQFYIVSWFSRNKNVLKDTSQQISYTRQEESLHSQAGIKIINTIREEHPELFDEELEEKIKNEALAAFKAEGDIIDWIMGNYQEEFLDSDVLKEYIKKRINDSLNDIGFSKVFDTDTELLSKTRWADEELYGNSMTDFFFTKSVNYVKSQTSFNEEDLF